MDLDVTTLRGRRATRRWERSSVGDVLERLTWSYPDQIAVAGWPGAYGDERYAQVTYQEADRTANRFAHALTRAGLEPGARVLLFCENSVEACLAKIGIAKAGMVAVPLNPNLAHDVIEHVIGLTEPRFAVVDAELWPRAGTGFSSGGLRPGVTITIGGDPVVGTPSFPELLDGMPDSEPDVEIHGDDIWELLFTSGTTSMPKGAMVSHHSTYLAAMNFALSLTRGLTVESDLRLATFLPVTYHVGDQVFMFSAFLSGGSLLVGRKPVPDEVVRAVDARRITALWAGSPQFVASLADEFDAHPELDLTSLRVLVYGWGALAPDLLDRLVKHCGPELVAMGIFGQTEAIACHRFWPAKWPQVHQASAPHTNYVGVPSPLLASDVVDESGQAVRGVPGEAVYRSPIITAGYYRNPSATREAFRGGWFHSGDSATIDDRTGLRIMVDRYKDIIKSGGENVSSIRVEAVLHTHPDVASAAVIGLPHPYWGEAVTAIIVPRAGSAPAESDVVAFCRQRLAGFETPKRVMFADTLPQTVGGKVLKYRLREEFATLYQNG
ncbi:acyl-CoA synthetase [Mycobacterium lentiflavum]|uniref:Long-chain-fatty-acid--CoA ligase FadD13 n=1 Tax=Mycobacterium lentiflavum TaxID=141349 RepID=A0A0E4H292_MYCLN|nr:AMP-binding protein [Mycobacterium lentiflavum]CQD23954.1 acyl-CoA synthetase [Mycobacterium lentiflavum]